jgi:DNA-directed RNA polymerase subunit RPC12/RpoP
MNNFLNNVFSKLLTVTRGNSKIPETREIATPPIREVSKPIADSFTCPYCLSKNFVKRGFRQKKMEKVQLYLCLDCHKTFTEHITKGKHYPLPVMFDAISIYNLGYSLEQTCGIINHREAGATLSATTLSNWLAETKELCRFERMREYALKKYAPKDMVIHATLAHRQLYRYLFHRAKCELIIQDDFKHHRFGPLQEFLAMVPGECPHQYFQDGLRASEAPLTFSKTQMIVRSKQNYATRLAAFVLQSVKDRKLRHDALQKFMLANDTVTVATEVPVYLTRDDLEHMQTQLGFEIYPRVIGDCRASLAITQLPKLITGHIDIIQIRNGQIHILDYKPNAAKERPIEQLTLYAMALSRLTGLRLFEFKCAWFDEKDYFEFFPLHVLHKPKKASRRRKIYTMEGIYNINLDKQKIGSVRPIAQNKTNYVIH